MSSLKIISVVVILNIYFLHQVRSDGLYNFVLATMYNYNNWIQAENLDPLKPTNYSTKLSNDGVLKIDCELSNQYVVGHSKEFQLRRISTDLIDGRLAMNFWHRENVTFKGTYAANGTVLGNAFNGSGNWFISIGYAYIEKEYRFSVTDDGFIDLQPPSYDRIYKEIAQIVTSHFEGLWDDDIGGYAYLVKEFLEKTYFEEIEHDFEHPLSQLFHTYLLQTFKSTPLSEIIGTTVPTTPGYTSTPISTSPTTLAPTTCAPCNCERQNTSPYSLEKIVKEETVSKRVEQDENGKKYAVTTKLILSLVNVKEEI